MRSFETSLDWKYVFPACFETNESNSLVSDSVMKGLPSRRAVVLTEFLTRSLSLPRSFKHFSYAPMGSDHVPKSYYHK